MSEKYPRMFIRVSPEKKAEWQATAKKQGFKSLSAYIKHLMAQDEAKKPNKGSSPKKKKK